MNAGLVEMLRIPGLGVAIGDVSGKGIPAALLMATPSVVLFENWLYVDYWETQRKGAQPHSPKNCLPGAG